MADTFQADRQIPFDLTEYDARLANAHARMTDCGIDALLVTGPENIFYLTGYQTFGSALQFLLVPQSPQLPRFILRELEALLVDYTTWSFETDTYDDSQDPFQAVADAATSLSDQRLRLGYEAASASLAPASVSRIEECLPDRIELVASHHLIESCRVIKSAKEIEICRRAAELTSTGMEAALAAIESHATENDVAAAAAAAMIQAGCEWFAASPIVTSGPRSGVPHTTFGRRRLQPGDTVLIELGAPYHRYFSPLMRTAALGPVDRETLQMYDACRAALEAAIAAARPGAASGDVHDACQKVIDNSGYRDLFKKRLGYSVGVGFRSWSEGHIMELRPRDERPLREGMVFHMPPALRRAFVRGVGISETVVVTATDAEPLGRFPRDIAIKS
jgi:Xaa-Pro dipeptidase